MVSRCHYCKQKGHLGNKVFEKFLNGRKVNICLTCLERYHLIGEKRMRSKA